MLFDPKLIAQEMDVNWEKILEWFPDLSLALIARYPGEPAKLVIERASSKQLEEFPDLEGKICYEHANGFSRPCEWCPVLQAIEDGQIHVGVARSPMPKELGSSVIYEPDMGEMVYAILVAIPLWQSENGANYVLEISFDRTEHERNTYARRTQEYEFGANLCRLIEMAPDDDTFNEFTLFGAVARSGIGFQTTHLFLIDNDAPNNLVHVGVSSEPPRRTTKKSRLVSTFRH